MSLPDEDLMRQIPEEYEGKRSCVIRHFIMTQPNYIGNPDDLLKELRTFVDLLINLEPSIIKTLVEKPQVLFVLCISCVLNHCNLSDVQRSITSYLKKLQVCDTESKLLSAIPDGLFLEHYVSLRLLLRRYVHRSEIFKFTCSRFSLSHICGCSDCYYA